MYLQHFGLKYDPLGKSAKELIDTPQHQQLKQQLNWLLDTRGIGVVTGDAGIGKTTAIREWVNSLNPLTHKVIYQPDNHFHAFDIYSQFAEHLGLNIVHRYSRLWRTLKQELLHCYEEKKVTSVWILDEAHQLPLNFFAELPAFLNFSFDTRDIMVILLVGNARLHQILQRSLYAPLASRIQFHFEWKALEAFEQFHQFIIQAFNHAGCQQNIMSQSAFKLLHMASKGRLRYASQIIIKSLQLASSKNLNHIPDDVLQAAIEQLRSVAAH
jgi:MSHA biogenesis protein MshM